MQLRRGEMEISADLRVAGGETVALLGPNGAGKTSLLRAIAGLVPLVAGWVRVDGDDWERPAAGLWLPAERRSVGFVFQDYLLFPHLSALDNVAYGLRHHGGGRAAARARAHDWLERIGIAELALRRPSQLSGVSNSGWRWPGPSPRSPRSCSSTSLCPPSTSPPAGRCGATCEPTWTTSPAPPCWSATIRSTPSSWRSASSSWRKGGSSRRAPRSRSRRGPGPASPPTSPGSTSTGEWPKAVWCTSRRGST